jgi:RNA polymerase sigma-70 factor, ECF subfamily
MWTEEFSVPGLDTTRTTTMLLEGLFDRSNVEAWSELDGRYRPIIIGFARRLGLNAADAADAAQSTLMQFFTEYREGKYDRSRGRLRSWLVGLAKVRVAAVYRERARRREAGDGPHEHLPDDATLTGLWVDEHREHLLRLAMDRLRETTKTSERSMQVFELLVVREMPVEAVARELGISEHDVYQAKSRVAERLRGILRELEAAYEEERG